MPAAIAAAAAAAQSWYVSVRTVTVLVVDFWYTSQTLRLSGPCKTLHRVYEPNDVVNERHGGDDDVVCNELGARARGASA